MTEKEFVIWLHGFLEISGATSLNEKQLQVIKDHLDAFFVKITPDRNKKKEPAAEAAEIFKKIQEEIDKKAKENPNVNPPWTAPVPVPPWNIPQPRYPHFHPDYPRYPHFHPDYPIIPDKIICSNGTGDAQFDLNTQVCQHPPGATYC